MGASWWEWARLHGFETYEHPPSPSTKTTRSPTRIFANHGSVWLTEQHPFSDHINKTPSDNPSASTYNFKIKNSSKSPSRGTFKNSQENKSEDPSSHTFTHPIKMPKKKTTHWTLFHTTPHPPHIINPQTLLPLAPIIPHLIHDIYRENFGDHTGHILLVIKAGSTSGFSPR